MTPTWLGLGFFSSRPGTLEQCKEILSLEAVPAGPPDGALIMQASARPGAHLVAREQELLGGTSSEVAGQKGCFEMLCGVELVLQLLYHPSIPRGVCSSQMLYFRH